METAALTAGTGIFNAAVAGALFEAGVVVGSFASAMPTADGTVRDSVSAWIGRAVDTISDVGNFARFAQAPY